MLLTAILAIPTVAAEVGNQDAVPLFECSFDETWDSNFDDWPDRWQRIRGRGFPGYVPISITADETDAGNRSLRIGLDGAAVGLISERIAINSQYGYELTVRVKPTGLTHDTAHVVLRFFDASGTVVESFAAEPISGTSGWQELRIGPLTLIESSAVEADLRLEVAPGKHPGLVGSVAFDDIRLSQIPRMTLSSNHPANLYAKNDEVLITCEFWGIRNRHTRVEFEMREIPQRNDRLGPIEEAILEVTGRAIDTPTSLGNRISTERTQQVGYAGKVTWRPLVTRNGFYKIRARLYGSDGDPMERTIAIAALTSGESVSGEFGWTLPHVDRPLSMSSLAKLLPFVGVHWVKVPIWSESSSDRFGDQIVRLTEHLSARNIELVGIIDHPPTDTELGKRLGTGATIADVMSIDRETWLPLLNPIMARLSLRIRWWQLGDDHDTSLTNLADTPKHVAILRKELFRFGQDVNLGVGWNWLLAHPDIDVPSWQFLQYSADPPLAGHELEAYLTGDQEPQGLRWALIEPLPSSQFNLDLRARDLIAQMLATKLHRADVAFVPNPFDPERGLMHPDGTPGALLLPWRTTATQLSGAEHVGSMQLPAGSSNHVFMKPSGELVMVVWSAFPNQESLYLGGQIEQIDAWGRTTQPASVDGRQVIDVGPLPTFVTGLDELVTRWRMGTVVEVSRLPSVFGQAHPNAILLSNPFAQGVAGTIRLSTGEDWKLAPAQASFKVAGFQTIRVPFDVILPFDASSGEQSLRIDFDFLGDYSHRFSVYRSLHVGLGDIEVEIETRLDPNGMLVVEQRTTSHLEQLIDLKYLLYAEGRRRQRKHVFRLGTSEDVQTYRYPRGEELIGKELWLRVEELDGPRSMNFRMDVKP